MTQAKRPSKKPAARARSRGARTTRDKGASGRADFSEILALIADAKQRGILDAKHRTRTVVRPRAKSTPAAPFARIVASAKTQDQQLRALEGAAQREIALPAEAFVVGGRDDIAIGEPIDLVVLACKSNALRCRLLGSDRELTLRTAVRDEVPGAIVTVMPTRQWTHARHAYLAGNVLSMRADLDALGLVPLALHDQGEWDPESEYWGEEGDPIDDWARPIIARGKRPMFEMQQVIPGADPEDFDSDPIVEASELADAGDRARAREILMNLLARDLRCLDSHAHLGNLAFDLLPGQALRHYEMGLSIGAFSLGKTFDGVLPWGLLDNRPFLRCLHGAARCWWRLRKTREAAAALRKMLWLNPSDNQGARFNLAALEAGKTWEQMEGTER